MFSSLIFYYHYFLLMINALILPHHILILGDSEAGISSHYISHVQQPNETISFEYKVGSIIEYWFGNIDQALNKHPDIDTIIIFLGTNNINRKYLDLSPILKKTNKYNCIWISPAKVKGYTWQSTKDLEDNITKNSTCHFFNSEKLDLTLYDGYHPTIPSMKFWLENIWEFKNETY